ncbi:hypothetical protein [Longimicrobium sp.]|jgi:hypothetical protein|uniref:hypothetical protein n=1 Tax=Longimicrobium sp. TaxID=2029185 RepID=UPI002EDAC3FB
MTSATQLREHVARMVSEHGHLAVATAAVLSIGGYAHTGMCTAAGAANEPLRYEATAAEALGLRVSAELRSALRDLRRAAGHQTYCTVLTVLVAEYSLRGARASAVDELSSQAGEPTAAPPYCPGCRERLAAGALWKQTLARTRAATAAAPSTQEAENG